MTLNERVEALEEKHWRQNQRIKELESRQAVLFIGIVLATTIAFASLGWGKMSHDELISQRQELSYIHEKVMGVNSRYEEILEGLK